MQHISTSITSIWYLSIALLIATTSHSYAQENTVTFDNQSGERALVRLIGPTYREVVVPAGGNSTVTAAAGRYHIKVRYGIPGKYRYTKGEEFDVTKSPTRRSKITVTLHKVPRGNYETEAIVAQEFEQGRPSPVYKQSGIQIGNYFLPAKLVSPEKTSQTRCGLETTPDGKFQKITTNLGDGYVLEYTGGTYPDITSPGAEITMLGNVEWYGYRFHSDPELPLVFKVVTGKGIVYLSGKGRVIAPSGEEHRFGSDMLPEKCIAALKSDQQLTPEGAAQALGYLKDSSAVDALMTALKDPSLAVQRNVIEALGKIGEAKALPTLQNAEWDVSLNKVAEEAIHRIQMPNKRMDSDKQ